jgi:hypothetical protein
MLVCLHCQGDTFNGSNDPKKLYPKLGYNFLGSLEPKTAPFIWTIFDDAYISKVNDIETIKFFFLNT